MLIPIGSWYLFRIFFVEKASKKTRILDKKGAPMAKYTELAEDIIKHVGGKENVNNLKHCVTRLRFDLKDESKADDDYLKNRDGVVTVVKAGGQYQVVIGNHVPDVYAEVLQVGGLPAGGSLDLDEGDAP